MVASIPVQAEPKTPSSAAGDNNDANSVDFADRQDIFDLAKEHNDDPTLGSRTSAFARQFTTSGVVSSKQRRLEDALADNDVPASYRTNSNKELLALEYVATFQRQFEQMFPQRKPLYLFPPNECGIAKFVCTTVRPSMLPYRDLYDYHQLARFLSGAIEYEPLENPVAPPRVLPSPSFVLKSRAADCFDLSVLLVSFLIGAGYDAYVVHGTAPRWICLLDQSKTTCPPLAVEEQYTLPKKDKAGSVTSSGGGSEAKEAKDVKEAKEADTIASTSSGTSPPHLQSRSFKSKYLQLQEENEQKAKEAKEKERGKLLMMDGFFAQAEQGEEEEDEDPFEGRRVHAWVLIRAGKRDVEEHFFLEPSTGRRYSLRDAPYLRLESVWNHENFWVNMQQQERISTTLFDLSNPTDWEYVFLSASERGKNAKDINGNSNGGVGGAGVTSSSSGSGTATPALGRSSSHRHGLGDDAKGMFAGGNDSSAKDGSDTTTGGSSGLTPRFSGDFKSGGESSGSTGGASGNAAGGSTGGSGGNTSSASNLGGFDHDRDNNDPNDDDSDLVLDVPPSWVTKLWLDRATYKQKFVTNSQRVTLYKRTKLEEFAENAHDQGLVLRITNYRDKACTLPLEIREFFKNRKDKLEMRKRFPFENRFEEYFAPGRLPEALKARIEWLGYRREFYFYTSARPDGLVKRQENLLKKNMEFYEGRDDLLVYRSVTFANEHDDIDSKNPYVLPGGPTGEMAVKKMTERFARNPALSAEENPRKKKYNVQDGNVHVLFQFAEGKITSSSRIYYKAPNKPVDVVLADPNGQKPKLSILDEEQKQIFQQEKDCFGSIRHSEIETQDILKIRKREDISVVLEASLFDGNNEDMRKAKSAEDKETNQEAKNAMDYLTPFLQSIHHNGNDLSKEDAHTVRDLCLRNLKERLLERANIIQARLDKENALLGKRQAAFQRSQREHDQGTDEEFERFCSETMFRIQILEQRLASHEETALQKYAEMDQRLHNDPRLKILHR